VLDGGVDGAWLRSDHRSEPGYRGERLWSDDALFEVLRAAAAGGWPVGMHVVGDAALDQALNTVARVAREHPVAGLRWMCEHAFLADANQIARVRALGMGVTVQPHLAHTLWSGLVDRWGRERAERVFPVRAWLDAGVPLGAGSDSPVGRYEPLSGIQWLVTRETAGGHLPTAHAMSIWEAMRAYTAGSAYVSFDERSQGELVPGAVADVVVLERDPFGMPPEEIGAIAVRAVLSDGRVVVDTF
jgi:predicted amidohydrolase YtcJ